MANNANGASNEIWILGATGRTGRAVAARLSAEGLSPVLVGRDATRLQEVAVASKADLRIVLADSTNAIAEEIRRNKPRVVVNTIGPFDRTAMPLVRACSSGTHYIDLCNDLPTITATLALHEDAVQSKRTIVTGAGFGVLATESVVLKLCAGQPSAERVRVDALAAVEPEAGKVGEALAASVIGVFADGGRGYRGGQLVRTNLMGDYEALTTPNGTHVGTAAGAWGELEAAQRASGAPFATAASNLVPPVAFLRVVVSWGLKLLQIPALRRLVVRGIAGIKLKPPSTTKASPISWAHARVEWPSGQRREGWLRTADAMAFTADVLAEVAMRLDRGEGRPGAFTPGALFGPDLAHDAGAEFLID